jgi:hypothetical protein
MRRLIMLIFVDWLALDWYPSGACLDLGGRELGQTGAASLPRV